MRSGAWTRPYLTVPVNVAKTSVATYVTDFTQFEDNCAFGSGWEIGILGIDFTTGVSDPEIKS
jgi:hypothetical protein